MRRAERKRREVKDVSVRVLCQDCHQFFHTPPQCLECSNWNVCLPCLEKESQKTRAILASRGIHI